MSKTVGPIRLTGVAHGGLMVGRLEGRVLFVRGGIVGELVDVEVTDDSHRGYWRGVVVKVREASPDRVEPPCPVADDCGGCDFQHIAIARQLALKEQVVREQLLRLAGVDWRGQVRAVSGPLGWRTRMAYRAAGGRVGLLRQRSHQLVRLPLGGCPLADPSHPSRRALERMVGESSRVEVSSSADEVTVMADGQVVQGSPVLTHMVGDRAYEVAADGFWQSHRLAAQVLSRVVVDGIGPKLGESALDLCSGSGLFAGALADHGVRVTAVESDQRAAQDAAENVPEAKVVHARMDKALQRLPGPFDIVVADPPRRGVGARSITRLARLDARVVAYVSCDPASLARDVAELARCGYQLSELLAFDLFPMTHHVECVAFFHPSS